MKIKIKKPSLSPRYLVIVFVLAVMLPVAIFPDRYLSSVSEGLNLFLLSVFPALFPFFFFSTVLSNLNFGYDLGLALKKPLKKFFNAPPIAGYVLVMSLLCGYPVGAKLLSDFCGGGLLTKEEAKSIAAFSSTSGPLFILGTVGTTMLSNKTAGFVILAAHYLSALINGLVFRKKRGSENADFPLAPAIKSDALLKESMTSSLLSVAIVGGYIAIFNLFLAMLTDVGVIDFLSKPFSSVLTEKGAVGLVAGLVEITKGCALISSADIPLRLAAPLCCFVVTNGGLSITLQSLAFLGKCKISPAYYLVFKLTQGIISFLICLCLSFLFL